MRQTYAEEMINATGDQSFNPYFAGMHTHILKGLSSGLVYDRHAWTGNGELLGIDIEARFDPSEVDTSVCSLWRYAPFIPVGRQHIVSLGEGFTSLVPVKLYGKSMLVKQEQLFPSGSYKDRGASVLISAARSLGIRHVVQDSSGNAGCAVAAYSARAGIRAEIYVPASTSPGKLAQVRMYGAELKLVEGSREDTARAAWEAAQHSYYASHCYNPYFFEGTKTFAYEVCEQLGWKAPDVVVLPAGNGTLVIGCYIGFKHLFESGVTGKMPKLVAVQSDRCAPLYLAWKKGLGRPEPVKPGATLAEGIAIAEPVRGEQLIGIVNETQGAFISVSDDEILEALKLCCRMGHYIEPTSAATVAGIRKALNQFGGETWVSLFSGHGLKSTEKMLQLLDRQE